MSTLPARLLSATLLLSFGCGDDDGGGSNATAPTGGPGTGGSTGSAGSSGDDPTDAGTGSSTTGTTGTTGDPTTTTAPGTTGDPLTTTNDTTTGGDPNDPFGPPPPQNMWPPGGSDHMTPSGVPFHVDVPAGDTSQAFLVIGGWFVNHFGPADGAITLFVNSDGTMGPSACSGGFAVPHNLNPAVVHEVLLEAGKNVQFDHKRAFIEASNNNAGWGVEAALDPMNQPFIAGVYVDWAEYNNAVCKAVTTPAGANSPRALFISQSQCDDTYCPLKACIEQVKGMGYDVTFADPLTPATCDCVGQCPGDIPRPHFKGPGSPAPIAPWVMATSKP